MKKKHIVNYIVLSIWALMILLLLGWVVYSSFKNNIDIYKNPWALPHKIEIENYISAWKVSNMQSYFLNSIVIVAASLIICILAASMAAYVLTRFRYRFRGLLLSLFIFGMSIPTQLILIPLYKQLMDINMINTRIGIVLVYSTLWMPFSIFVLTGFFKTIPSEIEESAAIEGCGEFRLFWRIMFPLVQPGVIAVTVFSFIGMWNEYMLALTLTSKKELRTLSLGMYALKDSMRWSSNWGGLFAAFVIILIPSIIVFLTLRKYVIQGMTLGAVKG